MGEDIVVSIVKSKNLTNSDKRTLERLRVEEFGEKNRKDFKKDYEPETRWFIVKKGRKIIAFGGIRPLKVKYRGEVFNIGGICSTIAVIKKKGYGRIMAEAMVKYSKRSRKSILGFTGKTEFFAKCGYGTKKDFIKRFVWVKEDGSKEYDPDGDGVYFEGKDKFISKVLKGKGYVEIPVEFW